MARNGMAGFALIVMALCLTIPATGCDRSRLEFVESDTSYSATDTTALLDRSDAGGLAGTPVSRAKELRHEALLALRRQGTEASQAADLMTRVFAGNTEAVPFYVERALYEGQPAYLIIEAAGSNESVLGVRRLWVIDMDGTVLLSRMN